MSIKNRIYMSVLLSSRYMFEKLEKLRLRKALFYFPFSLKSYILTRKEIKKLRNSNYIYNIPSYTNIKIWLPSLKKLHEADLIQRIIFFKKDFFEGEMLRKVLKHYFKEQRKYTIVDVGGNIGNHSIFFATQVENSVIYTFEPIPAIYAILRKNIEVNNLFNKVKLYNYACGANEGNASIYHADVQNIGATSITKDSSGTLKIIKLDDILNNREIDFIKIDVEGFEYDVLIGAQNILKNYSPVIWIEIFPENYIKVTKLLNKLSYKKFEKLDEKNFIFKKC